MADFAAVLKKTLEKMGETTPEVRAQVYEKARDTVKRQIDAMEKTPPQAAVDRQFAKLEDAISAVELEYAPPAVDDLELDEILDDVEPEPVVEEPEPVVEEPEPVEEEPEPVAEEAEPEADAPADVPDPEPVLVDDEPVVDQDEVEEPVTSVDAVDEAISEADGEIVDDAPDVVEPDVPAFEAEPELDSEPEVPVSNRISEIKARARKNAALMEAEAEAVASAENAEDVAAIEDVVASMPDVDTSSDPLEDFLKTQTSSTDENMASVDAAIGDLKSVTATQSDDVLGDGKTDDDSVIASVDTLVAGAPGAATVRPQQESGGGGIIKTLVVLGVLGGGGYYAYENQDQIKTMWTQNVVPWWNGLTGGDSAEGTTGEEGGVPVRTVTTTTVENDGSDTAETPADETPAAETPGQTEITDVSGAEPKPKFTQRLTEDGTEVDDGPATSPPSTVDEGEGSSVFGQTTPGDDTQNAGEPADEGLEPTTPETPAVDGPQTQAPQTLEPTTATPVGQRAIFYEERTGAKEGTALAGATIWSVVNVSPGGDLPVEPAIRAVANVPELGIQMEMTIRRNGDKTFPASHIIELFFRVPDTFEGRGIADVQRVTFKDAEQDPGNALIAVPAPLDQNVFMIALTDAATAVDTNVQLMKREKWIDIPLQYTSGRRALITFEKGIPGERVFNEVFAAWEATPIN